MGKEFILCAGKGYTGALVKMFCSFMHLCFRLILPVVANKVTFAEFFDLVLFQISSAVLKIFSPV